MTLQTPFLRRAVRGATVLLLVVVAGLTPGLAMARDNQPDGLTLPAADAAIAFVAPDPDQSNYAARLQVFLQTIVPDTWHGQPVQFLSTFNTTGGTAVWGLPTSLVRADPNNPNFVYQRFENGILFYNATSDTTQVLSLNGEVYALTPDAG